MRADVAEQPAVPHELDGATRVIAFPHSYPDAELRSTEDYDYIKQDIIGGCSQHGPVRSIKLPKPNEPPPTSRFSSTPPEIGAPVSPPLRVRTGNRALCSHERDAARHRCLHAWHACHCPCPAVLSQSLAPALCSSSSSSWATLGRLAQRSPGTRTAPTPHPLSVAATSAPPPPRCPAAPCAGLRRTHQRAPLSWTRRKFNGNEIRVQYYPEQRYQEGDLVNPSKLSMLDADKQAKVRTACVAHQFWLAHCPTQRVVRLASVQIQIPI